MWSHLLQKFAKPLKVCSHQQWNFRKHYEGIFLNNCCTTYIISLFYICCSFWYFGIFVDLSVLTLLAGRQEWQTTTKTERIGGIGGLTRAWHAVSSTSLASAKSRMGWHLGAVRLLLSLSWNIGRIAYVWYLVYMQVYMLYMLFTVLSVSL